MTGPSIAAHGLSVNARANLPVSLPATVHGTGVVIGETGILIRGASGAGKSRLALALIEAAGRDGRLARLIGDDRMILRETGGRIIGAGHPGIAGQIEQRGEGILEMAFESPAVLHCVIDLVDDKPGCGDLPRWPEGEQLQTTLGRVILPLCRLTACQIGSPDLSRALRFARRHGPQKHK